jgi:undecaprenyl-diphosphatase
MLENLDVSLFFLINHLPHLPVVVFLASLFSGIGPVGLISMGFVVSLFFYLETKNHWFFLPITLSGFLSYVLAEEFIKSVVARPRPELTLSSVVVFEQYPGYSFPSTHTTTAFACAYILSRFAPRYTWLWFLLAACVGFSRMYVGAHYPSDVLAGGILGVVIGFMIWRVTKFLKLIKHKSL